MSFNIAQFRKTEFSKYISDIAYTKETIRNTAISVKVFNDDCLTGTYSMNQSYYLVFNVKQLAGSSQDFTIKLTDRVGNIQNIKNISVSAGTGTQRFEIVFTPFRDFTTLVFEMQREDVDYSAPRTATITVDKFCKIENIFSSYLKAKFPGLTSIKKLGIQGTTGQIFVLDGEEIHIGKSGIYELDNEEINISSVGFVPMNNEFFIMDFEY